MYRIRLARHSKSPPEGSWHTSDDESVHRQWIDDGFNIGTMLRENGLVVVDIDRGKAVARAYWRANRGICKTVVETRRGIHIYLAGVAATRRWRLGDIKGSGYVVSPPSRVKTAEGLWQYRWIVEGELPRFSDYEHLFHEEHARREVVRKQVKNVRAYLTKVVSVEGQHGSHGLVRAAAICRDAGMSESEATIALLEWNSLPVVSPPWPHEEIARAVTRVFQKGKL